MPQIGSFTVLIVSLSSHFFKLKAGRRRSTSQLRAASAVSVEPRTSPLARRILDLMRMSLQGPRLRQGLRDRRAFDQAADLAFLLPSGVPIPQSGGKLLAVAPHLLHALVQFPQPRAHDFAHFGARVDAGQIG